MKCRIVYACGRSGHAGTGGEVSYILLPSHATIYEALKHCAGTSTSSLRGCASSRYVAEVCTVQQLAAFPSAIATWQRQIFVGGRACLILLECNILAALTAGSSTRSTQTCVGTYV